MTDYPKFKIRNARKGESDDDLRDSLKAHGWLRHLPAIKDRDGNVIMGNRRLRIAAELNIAPVIVVVPNDPKYNMALAIASNRGSEPLTKEERQKLAQYLYEQGWTMQRVGDALGVSKATISGDLSNCSTVEQLKPRKTATNPKGAGRPKGSKRTSQRGKSMPKLDKAREIVRKKLDADQPIGPHKLQDEHGISHVTFDMAITAELARKEALQEKADEEVDVETFPKKWKAKYEAAVRRERRAMEKTLAEERRKMAQEVAGLRDKANAEVNQFWKQHYLPHYNQQLAHSQAIIKARRGVFTKEQYRQLLAAVHPDQSMSKEKLAEVFDFLKQKERVLLSEKEMPTETRSRIGMPETEEEWAEAKRKATEERAAKRAASKAAKAPV